LGVVEHIVCVIRQSVVHHATCITRAWCLLEDKGWTRNNENPKKTNALQLFNC